jgi:sugar lactone lactonase YvrE
MGLKMRSLEVLSVAALAAAGLLSGSAQATCPPGAPPITKVRTVATFDQSLGESPEDINVDHLGNLYVSLSLKGEILKIAPDGTQTPYAQLPIGTPFAFCSGFYALLGPITFDLVGNLYASVGSCDPEHRGVFKVAPNGAVTQLVKLPFESFPNGIALHNGQLYVADSNLALIWKIDPHSDLQSGAQAEVWATDPLISRKVPGQGFPGANGLQFHGGKAYVAATDRSTIVTIPVKPNGKAGKATLFATTPAGCDDFAFDIVGNLYCGSFFDQVIRVRPDGTSEAILTGGELDGPTSIAFGRTWDDFLDIYVTNGSFPGFSAQNKPSLQQYRVGIPGEILYSY